MNLYGVLMGRLLSIGSKNTNIQEEYVPQPMMAELGLTDKVHNVVRSYDPYIKYHGGYESSENLYR